MITIDGTMGEGGGQILRTSLSLSLITGTPVKIKNIRGKRRKPGLMRQHLTCVRACKLVSNAKVKGDELGASHLEFVPGEIAGGDYHVKIGSAGSTTLVLQTVLPALLRANSPSTIRIEGGTHNPLSPSVEFLRASFLPQLNAMGANVELQLERHGFNPAGGGAIVATVQPWTSAKALQRTEAKMNGIRAHAIVSSLPRDIAVREIDSLKERLGQDIESTIDVVDSDGPGNYLAVTVEYDSISAHFSTFGEKGVSAGAIARGLSDRVRRHLKLEVPVEEYLADQLMLPAALGAGVRYKTGELSMHSQTQLQTMALFMPDLNVELDTHGAVTDVSIQP